MVEINKNKFSQLIIEPKKISIEETFAVKNIVKEQENVEGNYDGFIGRVTNFNWKFINGIYECSINVLTTGDVIESLKINLSK